jgi:hypothetical protein
MNENEQPPKFELPVPREVGLAAIACFAALTGLCLLFGSAFSGLEGGWAKSSVYAPLPLLVTFAILYRSDWHRQNSGAARMGSLLLASSLILAGILAALAVAVVVAGFFSLAVNQGVAGR